MALDITGATHGYDGGNLKTLLNQINTECIDPAVKALKSGLDTLNTEVDAIWVGDSAKRYKAKIEDFAEQAGAKLKEVRQQIEDRLEETGDQLVAVDEGISI